MTDEKGALSIDFLVGFTIFLLGFIWVVSMIPGLLIGLQAFTIDYDAVAYRTSVILVEDPGEPALPLAVHPWEYLNDPRDVVRFGLAISKDTPNVLSQDKVNRFFCSTAFSYPSDYQNKTIFGNYPYQFNISLLDIGRNTTLTVGDAMPPNSSYGNIRRLVKIKGSSNATIDSTRFILGGNENHHEFTILFNNTELLAGQVRDPVYQIDPEKENIMINITNINSTLGIREPCFDISLSKRITVFSLDPNTNTFYTVGYFDNPVIDGNQYNLSNSPPYGVRNNISMLLNPIFIPWSNYKQVYVSLDFDLIGNGVCPNVTGSQFLNNSIASPFNYNYDQNNVTQPSLWDAVLEVSVGSGYRTITETLIKKLKALFTWDPPASTTITFRDQSIGSPVSWEWNFGDGTPNGTSSIVTHPFALPGIYTVSLTVTDTNGESDSTSHPIDLSAPVAGFSANPVNGTSPVNVQFTDNSLHNPYTPSSWLWEYNKTVAGSWTTFSTNQSPLYSISDGIYDIRLTVTNIFGSNATIRPAYITATATHNITAAAGAGGTITPSGVVPVGFGASQAFTIAPNTSYHITDVLVDGSSVGAVSNYTFNNVISDHTISASFAINSFNITASAGSGGTISPSGAVSVGEGTNQIFTITKNAGYYILDVLVDGSSVGAVSTYTFNNILTDHTISASFAANAPIVIFSDNFDPGFSGWNPIGDVSRQTGSVPKNGTASIRLRETGSMQRTISTSGYSVIGVSFAMAASSLDNSGENVYAEWFDGSTWSFMKQITFNGGENDNTLRPYSYSLPSGASHNPNFRLRFRITGSGTGDYGYVDDVLVMGIPD